MHHFFMEEYARAWPRAAIVAFPRLPEKRRDLFVRRVLGDLPIPDWAADLDQAAFAIGRLMTEIVSLPPSFRTLLSPTSASNFGPDRPLLTRLVARAMGV